MYSLWSQRKRIKLSSAFTSLHQLIRAFQLFLKYVDEHFFLARPCASSTPRQTTTAFPSGDNQFQISFMRKEKNRYAQYLLTLHWRSLRTNIIIKNRKLFPGLYEVEHLSYLENKEHKHIQKYLKHVEAS